MADYAGILRPQPLRAPVAAAQSFVLPALSSVYRGIRAPLVGPVAGVYEETGDSVRDAQVTFAGALSQGPGQFWFDHVHSVPQFIALGNIVTTVTRQVEIYNAFHIAARELQIAENNAGGGTTLLNVPVVPYDIAAQHSLFVELRVATSGPPTINGTLVFTLDSGVLTILVTGSRVVMFPYPPESPIDEELEWKTTVLPSADGREQRIALRRCPRQSFNLTFAVEDDRVRRTLHSLVFGWLAGVFGIPVWFEARRLTVDAAAADTVIQVDTRFADFRDGGLAIVWYDEETYDALEIAGHTDSSITFSSPLTQPFAAATSWVMPLRTALADPQISGTRHPVGLDVFPMTFHVLDNDAPATADASAFPSYGGRVLLNGPNFMGGDTAPRGISMKVGRHDNETGAPAQFSDWRAPQGVSQKGFFTTSDQQRWEVRQLLHALRGPQAAFYLPTFYHDLVAAGPLSSGSSNMDIENIGYTRYINGQAPNNHIWVELLSGVEYCKEIVSSVVLDDDVERLTLSDAWPTTIQISEIRRISYLPLSRVAEDSVRLQHSGSGETAVVFGVLEVQQ